MQDDWIAGIKEGEARLRLVCNACGRAWTGIVPLAESPMTPEALVIVMDHVRELAKRRGWTSQPAPDPVLSVVKIPLDGTEPTTETAPFDAQLDFCPDCSQQAAVL